MRLTQIKLAGFKSFVDPTVIPTPSELVGVVGPNGCGKSNIIDAVRWVLGESRASELRGASMQDVIFNGSSARRPAARASVELVFDNQDGRAAGQWSAYAEIAVRRVLTRDDASRYFINNQPVRRRDVHDIFLGTGLGTRGYAIIGQGMINQLIEARPEDLRVTLEEAAGVSRYRERRRETEARLAQTRDNLSRLEDVIAELGAQLTRLEAQAQVARRYRSMREEQQHKQQVLWLLLEGEARAARDERAAEVAAAQAALEASVAAARAQEAVVEDLRGRHFEAGEQVHGLQGQLFALGAEVSRHEAEIRHIAEARQKAQARGSQLAAQRRDWVRRREDGQQSLTQTQSAADEARVRAEGMADLARTRGEQLATLERDAQAQQAQCLQLREALSVVQRDWALADQEQRALASRKAELDAQDARLSQEQATLAPVADAELERATDALQEARASLAAHRLALARLQSREPTLGQARSQAEQAHRAAQLARERLDAQRQALVALQERVQAEDALVPWLRHQAMSQLAPLWQALEVESGWERALEAVLRERLGALPLPRLELAAAMAGDPPPARLAFYEAASTAADETSAQPECSLYSHIRSGNQTVMGLLADWLRGVWVAASLEQALARRGQLPVGGMWVLAEGHCVTATSVRFYAADPGSGGLLARRQQIDGLDVALAQADATNEAAGGVFAQAAAAHELLVGQIRTAREQVSRQEAVEHDLQMVHQRIAQEQTRQRERAQRLDQETAEVHQRQAEVAQRREDARVRCDVLAARRTEQADALAESERAAGAAADQVRQVRREVADVNRRAAEADYDVRAQAGRLTELHRTLQLAAEQIAHLDAELEVAHQDLAGLDESAAQALLQEALTARAACEQALRAAREDQQAQADALRGADEQRLMLERDLEPLRARVSALQLEEQASRLTLEQMAAQLDDAQVDRAVLAAFLAEQNDKWHKPDWLQAETRRLARSLEALGAVNLAALDELQSTRERETYLTQQRQDVQLAIDTLEGAIRTIDRETRTLLSQTFDAVNAHFGALFPQLFGGGEAYLTLVGDEVLDAGVQVMARPPGKRNSTIQLLSGGEKALAATALVFALFKLNPAPFCLLDEVDAPLDDANTERFAQLVRGMSQQTQFLFISHNKIAMRMARHLVGVTMQEQGVSRIVAVDMDAALHWATQADADSIRTGSL